MYITYTKYEVDCNEYWHIFCWYKNLQIIISDYKHHLHKTLKTAMKSQVQ